MDINISLHFSGYDSPSLEQVEFFHPHIKKIFHSVRGKTSGSYETNRTFQWTSAVQAVSILFLRAALYNITKSSVASPTQPTLEGEKGSIVASLDYALDKHPVWLTDMFGTNSDGKSYLKNLLTRNNPGLRRSRSIRIGLKSEQFGKDGIKIYWNESTPINEAKILQLLRALEKSTGTLSLTELKSHQQQNEPKNPTLNVTQASTLPNISEFSPSRGSPHSALFKTPFLKQRILGGDAYVRCYEQGIQNALVVSFVPYEDLNRQRRLPVRIHSSCTSSEAFSAVDCDCKSQLDYSISLLREEAGILIYLQQEGRGAGLFSKYRGMGLSSQLGIDSYQAYKKMNIDADNRNYELVRMILQDLGINQIDLLTNNPKKSEDIHKLNIDVTVRPCLGKLFPQNLSYLYSKMLNGEHKLENLFEPSNDSFHLIESPNISKSYKKIWIFSGDDTLWEDNIIYEDLIRLFIDHICHYVMFPRDRARQYLDQTETRIIPQLGFGSRGFLVSLKETLEIIKTETQVDIPEPVDLFNSVIPRLSMIGTDISFKTVEVLGKMRSGENGLVLFIQGPVDFQLRKVALSRLGEFFDAISIVPEKNEDTLKQLVNSLTFKGSDYYVVGNNLKTDILPAVKLGYRAFYYNNPNSWQLLNRDECRSSGYEEIDSLDKILAI